MSSSLFLRRSVLLLGYFSLVKLSSCDFASLALATQLTPASTSEIVSVNYTFCAVFNPSFVAPPTQSHPRLNGFHQAIYPLDRLGCSMPADLGHVNGSLVVDRGTCTFYEKAAVAQKLDANMLVVVYNSTNLAIPDLEPNSSSTPISIPVLIIGNDSGQQLKTWLTNSSAVYLSAYIPPIPSFDPSSILLFAIAVGTMLMAAFLANNPFQFLKYGLLFRPDTEHMFSVEENSSTKSLSVVTTVIGMFVMVLSTCALLLLLYFFYTPMVYIVLALYCVASVFGLYYILSPFVALISFGKYDKYSCRLSPNQLPVLKYRPNILFFLTVAGTVGVVLFWVLQRHSSFAWVIQDVLGFAFITMLLSRLKFLKAWVVAVLMVLLFFYDIFMVFVTPYFTSDGVSVMEKAATGGGSGAGSGVGVSDKMGEMLPVVFLVPKFWFPSPLEATCSAYVRIRPSSLLGYGDVGIPGLLVTLCLKYDLQHHAKKCFKLFYFTSAVAYIVGLACTYLGLTLMQMAQPALLYLVPTTLGSVLLVSLFKKEFFLFFTGNERQSKSKSDEDKVTSGLVQSSDNQESDMEVETVFARDESESLIRKN